MIVTFFPVTKLFLRKGVVYPAMVEDNMKKAHYASTGITGN